MVRILPSLTTWRPLMIDRSTRSTAQKEQRCDRIMDRTASHCDSVQIDSDHVRGLSSLQRPDLVKAPQNRCAPHRRKSEPCLDPEARSAVCDPLQEHGRTSFGQQMASVVAGRPVNADSDVDARIQHVAHAAHSRSEPHVRRRAVRDPGACLRQQRHLGIIQVHGVRPPHVGSEPTHLLHVLGRGAGRISGCSTRSRRGSRRHVCAE